VIVPLHSRTFDHRPKLSEFDTEHALSLPQGGPRIDGIRNSSHLKTIRTRSMRHLKQAFGKERPSSAKRVAGVCKWQD
jgi:hypothetical protein